MKIFWRAGAPFTFVAAILSSFTVGADAVQPLPFKALAEGYNLSGQQSPSEDGRIAVSPDGTSIAYTLEKQSSSLDARELKAKISSVWVTDLSNGASKMLCCDSGSARTPRWSPDGRRLAFLKVAPGDSAIYSNNATLVAWNRADSTQSDVGTGVLSWTFFPPFDWLGSGRIVARLSMGALPTPAVNPLAEIPQPSATPLVFVSSAAERGMQSLSKPADVLRWYSCNFAVLDLNSRAWTTIVEGHVGDFSASPDGRHVAFASAVGVQRTGFGNPINDIVIWDQTTREETLVRAHSNTLSAPLLRWNSAGDRLAFQELSEKDRIGSAYLPLHIRYGEYSLSSKALSISSPVAVMSGAATPPMWLAKGAAFAAGVGNQIWLYANGAHRLKAVPGQLRFLVPRTNAVTVAYQDTSTGVFHVISIESASKSSSELYSGSLRLLDNTMRVMPQGWVFFADRADMPPALMVAAWDFKSVRTIAPLNPTIAQMQYGVARVFQWRNKGDALLAGILALPTGYDSRQRYPVIVKVYPNIEHAADVNCFGGECFGLDGIFNTQLYQTRGYIVFTPTIPVHPATRMSDIIAAVDTGLKKLIASGSADPKRIGVFGQSQGGYTALSLAVGLPHLRAVVAASSYANYIDFDLLNLHAKITESQDMAASLWEQPQRFVKNSPVFYMNKVQAPILLLHGRKDTTTTLHEAETSFGALKLLGKPAELVVYPFESHSPIYYNLADQVDYFDRMIGWFDKYLGVRP